MTYTRFIATSSSVEAKELINDGHKLFPTYTLANENRLRNDKIFEVIIEIKEIEE